MTQLWKSLRGEFTRSRTDLLDGFECKSNNKKNLMMHKARYWCYHDGVPCTALTIVNASDTTIEPPLKPDREVGIIIGFNPPKPTIIPCIGLTHAAAQPNVDHAAAFHVQAQRRFAMLGGCYAVHAVEGDQAVRRRLVEPFLTGKSAGTDRAVAFAGKVG